jgi:hypothetical protein
MLIMPRQQLELVMWLWPESESWTGPKLMLEIELMPPLMIPLKVKKQILVVLGGFNYLFELKCSLFYYHH